jgi:peptide/nickel transport system substrate-binding protein
MKRKHYLVRVSAILLFSILFIATNVYAELKGTVNVALASDPGTVNMLQIKQGVDIPATLHMHQALIVSTPDTGEYTFTGSLTKSAEVLENGKDIKFIMNKGNFFHTGDPVTAHDVKFTYEQCANPINANLMAGPLDEIEDIEILDDYSFIFHFYEPYAAWRRLLWIGIASKNYYEKVGRAEFAKHPVGSGPFRFVSRKIGESITLEANENFRWIEEVDGKAVERKVEFKTLKFLIIPDEFSRLAMLETGGVDLVSDILPHHAKRLEKNKKIIVKREESAPSLFAIASKPNNYPIFKDLKFSEAFQYAINRQEIVDKIYLGEGYPMYMYASKSELGYNPDIFYEFNPDKARRLIKQSSYKGQPIILTYTSLVPNCSLVAATVQNYMKNVGVNIKLQKLEPGIQATYTRTRDPKEGHMTLYSWAGGKDPNIRLMLTMPSDSPYAAWPNKPSKDLVDNLLAKQSHETDKDKRLAILNELHKILDKERANTSLFGLNQIYAMTSRIEYQWLPKEAFLFNLNSIKIVE